MMSKDVKVMAKCYHSPGYIVMTIVYPVCGEVGPSNKVLGSLISMVEAVVYYADGAPILKINVKVW